MLELKSIRYQRKREDFFTIKQRPNFNEVDSYQVVWNGHYVNYFEKVRLEMCRQLGISIQGLSEMGVLFPVYKFDVTMKRPVFIDDEMEIAVRPIIKDFTWFEFRHYILVNNEVRVVGNVHQILIDRDTKNVLMEMPSELQKYLHPLYEEFYERDQLLYTAPGNAL